ncbi:hypothetical protein, partial [Burkholderia cenocepacia]|uniref:hypothetical protein n=1 Tax=Burkholderia cenocepacia TaxID=95486 RepID=UPI0038CC0318
VLACIALLKAFHFEVASTPRYVRARVASATEMTPEAMAEAAAAAGTERRGLFGRRREISSTFAGLGHSQPSPSAATESGEVLIALHPVPTDAVDVDADGVASLDEDRLAQDPIAGEVFDTPEFAASQAAVDLE